jgi:anti-sigma B factor antagonist
MSSTDPIASTPLPDGVVITPRGDVDLSRSPHLRKALAAASQSKPQRLVVDLGQVSYMDSSGVATLVEALQIARRNGTTLVLAALQPRVRSIMEIARLDTVFRIVESAEAAREI